MVIIFQYHLYLSKYQNLSFTVKHSDNRAKKDAAFKEEMINMIRSYYSLN